MRRSDSEGGGRGGRVAAVAAEVSPVERAQLLPARRCPSHDGAPRAGAPGMRGPQGAQPANRSVSPSAGSAASSGPALHTACNDLAGASRRSRKLSAPSILRWGSIWVSSLLQVQTARLAIPMQANGVNRRMELESAPNPSFLRTNYSAPQPPGRSSPVLQLPTSSSGPNWMGS